MQPKELIQLVQRPGSLDKGSIKPLQELVHDFPYFQGAHILLSLASKKWDASVYQQSLKRTAISVTNRSHLFSLLHTAGTEEKTLTAEQPAKTEPAAPPVADPQHELDILKAAEVSLEPVAEVPLPEIPLPEIKQESPEVLDKEIARQVVSSYVEKEIVKTPDLHKPVATPLEQPESFGDWLAFLKKNNGQPYSQIEEKVNTQKALKNAQKAETAATPQPAAKAGESSGTDSRKLKNKAIIDRIIEKNPGLIRTREEQKFFAPETKAKESLLENEHLMTETLARIYALQGNIGKAVRAYEILSLKYPQKSAYFATLIQQLKNNSNH